MRVFSGYKPAFGSSTETASPLPLLVHRAQPSTPLPAPICSTPSAQPAAQPSTPSAQPLACPPYRLRKEEEGRRKSCRVRFRKVLGFPRRTSFAHFFCGRPPPQCTRSTIQTKRFLHVLAGGPIRFLHRAELRRPSTHRRAPTVPAPTNSDTDENSMFVIDEAFCRTN
jgi:hypothetical protein